MLSFKHSSTYAAASASLAALAFCAPSVAQSFSVTVNGSPVTINPSPIERVGRVFVPLRGIFERLGASVVYSGGVINATGNNRSITLQIGSTQATVDGQARSLDVAPFILGASTYVPLRFVSQALGAGVNYDAANRIVALTTSGNAPPAAQAPAPSTNAMIFQSLRPARDASVQSEKPTIEAAFTQTVDPNSVRITLDGLDITGASTRSQNGFIYAPSSPLQSSRHTVTVSGALASGQNFNRSWSFTSGTAAPRNALQLSSPENGAPVGSSFNVAGRTVPNARVHIVAGAVASLGGVFAFGAGNYSGDTIADGNGDFSQQVQLQTVGGATIGLTVTSTDPATNESAQRKLQLRAQ